MAKLSSKRLTVRVRDVSCPIVIGMGLEKEITEAVRRAGAGRIVVIADSTTRKLFGAHTVRLLKHAGYAAELVSFPAGERSKSERVVSSIQHTLLKRRFGRDTLVIALGGGVVGDVAGYVAATYLRGVPYLQVPTTLLAIVDSSVGGKVGVDTAYGKNMIGVFYQPRAVIADLSFVASLRSRQVVNGLMEALKTFLTSDRRSLALIEKFNPAHPLKDARLLQEIAYRAVRLKAAVVMKDEEEKNERRILNFGHTIGHALELLSGYRLPHGFAVAYGMLAESKISELSGILSSHDRVALARHLARFGVRPSGLQKYPVAEVLKAVKGDKKARRGMPHYVLLRSLGSVYQKGRQYAHPVPERMVKRAYESLVRA